MLPRRGKAFSPDVVSTELPESATKTDKSLGSFDYAPLSFETNMVVEALRSGRQKHKVSKKRTDYFFFETSQPLPHQQTIDRIQIIAWKNFQHRVAMFLVELERGLVIHSDFKRHIVATGGLQFALGGGH